MRVSIGIWCAGLTLISFGPTGCGGPAEDVAVEAVSTDEHAGHDYGEGEHAEHDHGGWWCNAHGVPEKECPLCDTSLVAKFKAKGDWCDEHNRPESQCFTCNPNNFETFAARYEARFDERPPQPIE